MRAPILALLLLASSGCIDVGEHVESTPSASTSKPTAATSSPSPTPSATTAPATTSTTPAPSSPVVVDGRQLTLDPYLWRDFQPMSEPGGKPLVALIKIWAEGDAEFPSDVVADLLRVRYGNETWETPFSNETLTPESANQTQRVARNGPKWGPNVEVDVEVRLSMHAGGPRWMVAKDVTIEMTV